MDLADTLKKLFHHDALARHAEEALLDSSDRKGLFRALRDETNLSRKQPDRAALSRLEVLAGLWGHVGGAEAAQVLIELLLRSAPSVQAAAGEALTELASTSFDTFARAVKELLASSQRLGPEIEELAFVLSEIEDPGVVKLLVIMLDHDDPRAVAAALEVAGEWGWDKGIGRALAQLTRDDRTIALVDDQEGEVTLSIAELASEVTEALHSLSERPER